MINQPTIDRNHFCAGGWADTTRLDHQGERPRRSFSDLVFRLAAEQLQRVAQPLAKRIRRSVIERHGPQSGRALEVGVSRGYALEAYRPGVEVTGTEGDIRLLASARARVASRALDHVAGLHRMAPDRLVFADGTFDRVTAFYPMRRAAASDRVIDELVRVTRTNGRIVIVDRLKGFASEASSSSRGSGILGALQSMLLPRRRREAAVSAARTLLRRDDLDVISVRPFAPFGLLTICECEKRASTCGS